MESKILKALADLSYNGPLVLDKQRLEKAVEDGPKSPDYTGLVSFLAKELKVLCNVDEEVNAITNPEDSITFLMELSSFLKELGCPYVALTQGHISDRLEKNTDRLLLLDYLTTELMAARILREKRPERKIELKIQETAEAANLRKMLMTLRFPKPPPNITVQQLFHKLTPTAQNAVQKAGKELLGNPLFSGVLSDKQWHMLEDIQKDLNNEYTIRREMLLKRLDCTIQSFEWSERMKGKEHLIEKIYADKRKLLRVEPDITLADLLAARDYLAIIEKTSNANVRKFTKSAINKVIIGQVPDRGGRTSEQAPPPPEMPSWQQRSSAPQRGRGGGRGDYQQRGGRGGGGGQYHQQQQSQSNYQSYGGGGGGGSGGYQQQEPQQYQPRGGYQQANRGYHSQSFDSAGSYGGGSGYSNEFRVGSKAPSTSGSSSRSFDSAGSYGNRDRNSYYSKSSGFDSAGSFSGRSASSSQDYGYGSESKRAKTYDSFQTNKSTYADQYVQDSQHNQQYHPRRGGGGGGGRSNYNRGGGGGGQSYR